MLYSEYYEMVMKGLGLLQKQLDEAKNYTNQELQAALNNEKAATQTPKVQKDKTDKSEAEKKTK